jgi:hypothetical protein
MSLDHGLLHDLSRLTCIYRLGQETGNLPLYQSRKVDWDYGDMTCVSGESGFLSTP